MPRVQWIKLKFAVDSVSLDFVLTVPAMWPDKAKMNTLRCAESAGYGNTGSIRLISEPEAAAIHALHASNAGGGNVDLITFSIVELELNFRLKEDILGRGSLCGSIKPMCSISGWDRDTVEKAMHRFEMVIKRTFHGEVKQESLFPIPRIADDGISMPNLEEVHNLVSNQMKTSKKKVKALFLVGGFGQSPYPREYLRNSLPQDIESYFHGHYRIQGKEWFIQKVLDTQDIGTATTNSFQGNDIKEAESIQTFWCQQQLVSERNFDSIRVTLYQLDTPAGEAPSLYFKRQGTLPIRVGHDNKGYYEVNFEIRATYFSTHCEYALWYKGQNHGSVKVDYS
ncbi:hypothetical protein BDV23DRAFT_173533 [Aspergillus alliaceus]|uniref:Uncharacterized protein n=1 Tax=Petromyces alliaceus TaxID=209559 RepID=A0A5N7C552_PETAA|nr:hypothetical protein BDV23DRAFT_173533 [Aspergillus alliaceus]